MTDLKAAFFMAGGRTGCLLLHGFTSTPAELLPLGEALHNAGSQSTVPSFLATARFRGPPQGHVLRLD